MTAVRRALLVVKQFIFLLNDVSGALVYLARARRPRRGLTVLCYHRSANAVPKFPPHNPYNVSPANLARHVVALRALPGVTVVSLADIAAWIRNGPPRSGSYLLLTFDDCWAHTVDAARSLARAKLPGAFFIPTGFVGSRSYDFSSFDRWYAAQPDANPDVYRPISEEGCRELVALGMDVQPHGDRHLHLGIVPVAEMKRDIERSVEFVRRSIGQDVIAFCYPFGSRHLGDYTPEVIETLSHTSAVMAFSTDAGVNSLENLVANRYALRRIPVNSYDGGLLFAAKASGYSGALPVIKAILHRARAA
jgi:peptidoglycan/xylan/chitin deacetylase (PgdA/CDA1 family)